MLGEGDRGQTQLHRPGTVGFHRGLLAGVPAELGMDVVVWW